MLNLLTWVVKENGEDKFIAVVMVRDKHRPSHFFAEGDDNILLSPASVDMGGVFITPLEKDFIKIGAKEIKEIMDEISVSSEMADLIKNSLKEQPVVKVGIMSENEIEFVLNERYQCNGEIFQGEQKVSFSNDKVLWNGKEYGFPFYQFTLIL